MITPNDFQGCDSEKIAAAIAAAQQSGVNRIVLNERRADAESDRNFWLIDEAILLPQDMELVIADCKIKLSDKSRDNFIRSANCGIGITDIPVIKNIRITGIGNAVLEGADRPRATGDANKILGERSYGTDAGKENEKQTGDWRNVGILLAKVENFAIENLQLRDYHCWGISLEKCAYGSVKDIQFDSCGKKEIDNKVWRFLNQDGLDIRKGSHHITVENISGAVGDDLVALTAIHPEYKEAGNFVYTEISGALEPLSANDLHDIDVKHIHGCSAGGHHIVRLLNTCGIKMYNITLNDIYDTSGDLPDQRRSAVAVRIGDSNQAYGGATPIGDLFNISIEKVDSRAGKCVLIAGSLSDSSIKNICNRNTECEAVECSAGWDNIRNVKIEC